MNAINKTVTNKQYIRSHEPIFWGLFGAGGTLSAFFTPIMLLISGLLIPLGILSQGNLSYQSLIGFASSWYGALILLVLICLPLWHTMHRIFHGLHDLGVKNGREWQKVLCYGFAFAITVFVFTLLLGMQA